MRETFPVAVSANLMPDHGHVVADVESPERARDDVVSMLGGFRRCRGAVGDIAWERVDVPAVISGPQKLARNSRYVDLNPSRAGLVSDPLEWEWSTYRDVVGATIDPWVTADGLARALGRSSRGFACEYHRYVTSDPAVDPKGSLFPELAIEPPLGGCSLVDLVAAAAAASRLPPSALLKRSAARRIFVELARQHGFGSSSLLAQLCGITRQNVDRRRACTARELAAARLCLGDLRLRAHAMAPAKELVLARLRAPSFDEAEILFRRSPRRAASGLGAVLG